MKRTLTVGLLGILLMAGCTQTPTQELADAKNEILTLNVKIAALGMYKTENTFQVPGDKNKFVFVYNDEKEPKMTVTVGLYDLTNDKVYTADKEINWGGFVSASETIYQEEVTNDTTKDWDKNRQLHVVGIDGNKLVFWEAGADNSPGPCASLWLDADNKGAKDLTYIDITAAKPERKPYVVPQSKIEEGMKEQEKCAKWI